MKRSPHAKLLTLARQHDYPLQTLRLALAAYRLPRVLEVDGVASQLTAASRGITAGAGHATTELRLLLLGLVEQLASCIQQSCNQLQASVYVDDVCVEAAGDRADGSAARDVAHAVEVVKRYFDALGMSLSTVKSKAVGSTKKVARELAGQTGGGQVLKPARVGKLLGAGVNGGSRRCVAVIAKRVRQYALKTTRMLSLRKRGIDTHHATRACAMPAMAYGTDKTGISDTMLLAMKRQVARSVGIGTAGASLNRPLLQFSTGPLATSILRTRLMPRRFVPGLRPSSASGEATCTWLACSMPRWPKQTCLEDTPGARSRDQLQPPFGLLRG